MMKKYFEKGSRGMRILTALTVLVGVVELIVGTGKGMTAPLTHGFCPWGVAGSGIFHVLAGMWGIRHLKGRRIVQKPEMLIVYENTFVLAMGVGIWLVAIILTLLGIWGSLIARPDEALLCVVMCLFCVIAFLLIYDYQVRRIVLYGNYILHTSFWGRERTFHKSELKVATISLLGAWAVYGMDDRVLFYIEDNMVNAKKFMGKMPNVFPLLVGTGKRRI